MCNEMQRSKEIIEYQSSFFMINWKVNDCEILKIE